jgi:hypothetical protein
VVRNLERDVKPPDQYVRERDRHLRFDRVHDLGEQVRKVAYDAPRQRGLGGRQAGHLSPPRPVFFF